MRKIFYFLVLCLPLFLISCKDKHEPPQDLGFGYFPNNVGHTLIYDVDSLFYDGYKKGKDTLYKYQIKEFIHSSFTDAAGKESQLIERYRRDNDSMPWEFMTLWTMNRTASAAEKIENNQRYVKLLFPPEEGKAWNGNMYNSDEEWEYYYKNVGKPASIGSFNFDSTLIVEQIDDSNFVNVRRAYEIYAKDIGMVYKRLDTLEQQYVGGELIPLNGVRYYMTLKSYSN